jgi:oligopeptide/dipeptide ABC transporter ATP-binding protein
MTATPLVEVAGLVKLHSTANGLVRAVDGVSLTIAASEVLGLVGESGCGKSTLGRAVIALEQPTQGAVRFDGVELATLPRRELRALRRQMQIVFQDPYGSLNPRSTVGEILTGPFSVHRLGSRAERRTWVAALLERVGLRPEHAERYPHEFSGGQRQRISIARAIALNPKLVVCDEAVSALDVSVQAQIINLLQDLQRQLGLTYLFISHDLAVVGHIAQRIAVMYLGQIVEMGEAATIRAKPRHPYTQLLFSAIPSIRANPAARIRATGEPPSPFAPPLGCRFHTRCPLATTQCREQAPLLREVAPGIDVACHFA